jgi:hypothetical protein
MKSLISFHVMSVRGLAFSLSILIFLGCSGGEDNPTSSPVFRDGRIYVRNETSYSIRLMDFVQERGDQEYSGVLDIRVHPDRDYALKNRIDSGNSEIFPGGDRIWVTFISELSDPNNPGHPLFENTVALTVNGNNKISVKSGGEYVVGPG